ncbi:hypothetical protein HY988_02945 [Candidatus Micrarchaeota archaeon]|nr:hypothetical protein [Candidatus Micrarchaeota archaeon]
MLQRNGNVLYPNFSIPRASIWRGPGGIDKNPFQIKNPKLEWKYRTQKLEDGVIDLARTSSSDRLAWKRLNRIKRFDKAQSEIEIEDEPVGYQKLRGTKIAVMTIVGTTVVTDLILTCLLKRYRPEGNIILPAFLSSVVVGLIVSAINWAAIKARNVNIFDGRQSLLD